MTPSPPVAARRTPALRPPSILATHFQRMNENYKKIMRDKSPAPPSTNKLGRYTVGAKIGVGAFSDVFVGHDESTGETRALKRRRPKFDDWDSVVKTRDVQAMARLARHPNIVAMFEVHRTSAGDLWLVFERMDVSLHDVLEHCQFQIPRTAIVDWTRDALVGLQFLHSSMYMHRDVKPENMLLSTDGTLKLSDFTLARGFHEAEHELTTYVSTRWYRAPEVLLGAPYGPPIDHFAAGCVFAEMFTRTALFPADTELSLFHQIVTCLGHPPCMEKFLASRSVEAPPPLVGTPMENLRRETGMPSDALEVLAGLLDVDPAQRWTTPRALEHPFFHVAGAPATSNGTHRGPATDVRGHAHVAAMTSVSPRNDPAMPASLRPSPIFVSPMETVQADSLLFNKDWHRSPVASSVAIRNPYHRGKQQGKATRG